MEIPAPTPVEWSVMTDVERWPEWTASISRVKRLSPAPLQVGSRVRIHQPKFPPALWRVTELNPGANHWRPSNLMKIPNADYLERTKSEILGARLWRLPPKSANTLHKHHRAEEFYCRASFDRFVRLDRMVPEP